eukprot:TRINITY_DN20309_c0_g1_i1.p1 TRINITY_DN20309_c0_g1~~TRINITY_DN20309_c0_g1_i1.p1  ORF type:complete len:294 (-),score=68.40 TRINITY_DN20309_c0_g1_i1:60-884(-)
MCIRDRDDGAFAGDKSNIGIQSTGELHNKRKLIELLKRANRNGESLEELVPTTGVLMGNLKALSPSNSAVRVRLPSAKGNGRGTSSGARKLVITTAERASVNGRKDKQEEGEQNSIGVTSVKIIPTVLKGGSSILPTEPATATEAKDHYALDGRRETRNQAITSPNHESFIAIKDADTSQQLPMAPKHALRSFAAVLTEQEKVEIGEFSNIYYVGHKAAGRKKTSRDSEFNGGHDDERGDYCAVIGDHIAFRYELIERLGRGSFGQVFLSLIHI